MPFRIRTARDADALRTVATPADHFHPATAQAAWAHLKAQRGQSVNLDRLGMTAHLIAPPPAPPAPRPVAPAPAENRVLTLIHAAMAARGLPRGRA